MSPAEPIDTPRSYRFSLKSLLILIGVACTIFALSRNGEPYGLYLAGLLVVGFLWWRADRMVPARLPMVDFCALSWTGIKASVGASLVSYLVMELLLAVLQIVKFDRAYETLYILVFTLAVALITSRFNNCLAHVSAPFCIAIWWMFYFATVRQFADEEYVRLFKRYMFAYVGAALIGGAIGDGVRRWRFTVQSRSV